MMTIKKLVYEASISGLLRKLSSGTEVDILIRELLMYRSGLKNADKLNETQALALDAAKELLAEEKDECVTRFGLAAWTAIQADSNGTAIAKAKATTLLLTGDSTIRRSAFVLDNALSILGINADVPKHITADGIVQLGNKAKRSSSSGQSNSERPSLRKVIAGSRYYWKHADVWYGIVGTSAGIRLFNLTTRVELTNVDKLPANASACQKLVTSWADAFRGYVEICPNDVKSLTDDELTA